MTKLIQKLFYSGYYFTIGLRHRTDAAVLDSRRFSVEYTIPANRKRWYADPILVEEAGRSYLFYEAVSQNLGRLEVREVLSDLSLSEPTKILSGPKHYSYPLVFRKNNCWYMIPESSSEERIYLYRAVSFPDRWEGVTELLHGSYVDTTVFPCDNRWILLTFEAGHQTEAVCPKAFEWVDNAGEVILRPLRWDGADGLSVRGAGPVFSYHGQLCRPAQKNQEQVYGDSLIFYQIRLTDDTYSETPIGTLEIENIHGIRRLADGLHTYSGCASFEAIDLRCRDFLLWKIPSKLLRALFRQRR